MQQYFEHLLNLLYREYYPKLANMYGKALPFASSYIKFGGFTVGLDWYGKTNLSYERLGEIHIITKTVFFNIGFLYHLAGWQNHQPIFHLKSFINTIAHEVAHCLLADFNPTKVRDHDEQHQELTKKVEEYLWTLEEVKELANLQHRKLRLH